LESVAFGDLAQADGTRAQFMSVIALGDVVGSDGTNGLTIRGIVI
jgi:hypothetical protein